MFWIWINLQSLHNDCRTYMYSMVPQKVWVTVPSWMDSLHRPKSVSFTWPRQKQNPSKDMWKSTLKTNNRLSIKLPREKNHSWNKRSYVERIHMIFCEEYFEFMYRCCWAWYSQASGLYKWCPSGAGDPVPSRSQQGRNCQEKQAGHHVNLFFSR